MGLFDVGVRGLQQGRAAGALLPLVVGACQDHAIGAARPRASAHTGRVRTASAEDSVLLYWNTFSLRHLVLATRWQPAISLVFHTRGGMSHRRAQGLELLSGQYRSTVMFRSTTTQSSVHHVSVDTLSGGSGLKLNSTGTQLGLATNDNNRWLVSTAGHFWRRPTTPTTSAPAARTARATCTWLAPSAWARTPPRRSFAHQPPPQCQLQLSHRGSMRSRPGRRGRL